jgi:hypothetical protein
MNLQTRFATGQSREALMRGYAPVYREASRNHCPGCGQSQWFIGRVMAQCAFCETALPLEHSFRFSGLTRV